MNIFVGNLPYETSEADVQDSFAPFGQIDEVRLITDRYSGRSKGFAFVDMPNGDEAKAAIEGLNGKDMQGRPLTVNEARPREDRRPNGGGGGGGGQRRW